MVPADLNAFLYQMEINIAWAANLLGGGDGGDQAATTTTTISQQFEAAARERRNSINKLLWDNEAGQLVGWLLACLRECCWVVGCISLLCVVVVVVVEVHYQHACVHYVMCVCSSVCS